MTDVQLQRLLAQLDRDLPLGTWQAWPGGWPNQIEAAVIDAVFSIQARYGRPGDCQTATGVRRIVACWRAHRGVELLDDLDQLTTFAGWAATQSRMAQRVSGRPKAEVVTDVAAKLSSAGARHARGFDPKPGKQRDEWLGTTGLGPVTWSYVAMLLGHPDVKADTMVTAYAARAVGVALASEQVRQLVIRAAAELARTRPDTSAITATSLDHAIWNFERGQRQA